MVDFDSLVAAHHHQVALSVMENKSYCSQLDREKRTRFYLLIS